ncbi:MAG: cytochrome-c oxidase, cbb3-type subunit III, partial [Burkholderiales bacterium]|nr:cytochrome-c oxidase, cbb3-type subunit III [Burkholderiales bacterium]
AVTLVSIVACLLLLWFTGKARAMTATDNTTGHVWDGDLREMNNPLPRWWAWLFVLTVIFALIYLALYPGLGNYAGTLGWTSTGQHQAELDKGNAEVAPLYAKFTAMAPEAVAADPQAMAIGERLFMNNCAQCHGSDARGSKGIPNLTDTDWLHGGAPVTIKETLIKGRMGNMPPMAAAVGSPEDVRNVAQYVLSLSGSPHDSLQAALGKPKFAVCAACHGADGKGNPALGAPNLTDDIWLHGYGEAAILAMVNNGKTNVMPPQGHRFTPEQLKVLTAYVWNLSQATKVAAR